MKSQQVYSELSFREYNREDINSFKISRFFYNQIFSIRFYSKPLGAITYFKSFLNIILIAQISMTVEKQKYLSIFDYTCNQLETIKQCIALSKIFWYLSVLLFVFSIFLGVLSVILLLFAIVKFRIKQKTSKIYLKIEILDQKFKKAVQILFGLNLTGGTHILSIFFLFVLQANVSVFKLNFSIPIIYTSGIILAVFLILSHFLNFIFNMAGLSRQVISESLNHKFDNLTDFYEMPKDILLLISISGISTFNWSTYSILLFAYWYYFRKSLQNSLKHHWSSTKPLNLFYINALLIEFSFILISYIYQLFFGSIFLWHSKLIVTGFLILMIFILKISLSVLKYLENISLFKTGFEDIEQNIPLFLINGFHVVKMFEENKSDHLYCKKLITLNKEVFAYHSALVYHKRKCTEVDCFCHIFQDRSSFILTNKQRQMRLFFFEMFCRFIVNSNTEMLSPQKFALFLDFYHHIDFSLVPVVTMNFLISRKLSFIDELKLRMVQFERKFRDLSTSSNEQTQQIMFKEDLKIFEFLDEHEHIKVINGIYEEYFLKFDNLRYIVGKETIELENVKKSIEDLVEIEHKYINTIKKKTCGKNIMVLDYIFCGHFKLTHHVFEKSTLNRKFDQINNTEQFDEKFDNQNWGFLICNSTKQKILTIVKCSKNIEKLTGFHPQSLIDSSPNCFLLESFHENHNMAITNFIRTGKRLMLDKERDIFIVDNKKMIRPLKILVQLILDQTKCELLFLAKINLIENEQNTIICDKYGQIESMTPELSKLLKNPCSSTVKVPIYFYFKSIFEPLSEIIKNNWFLDSKYSNFFQYKHKGHLLFKDEFFINHHLCRVTERYHIELDENRLENDPEEIVDNIERLLCKSHFVFRQAFASVETKLSFRLISIHGQVMIEVTINDKLESLEIRKKSRKDRSEIYRIILLRMFFKMKIKLKEKNTLAYFKNFLTLKTDIINKYESDVDNAKLEKNTQLEQKHISKDKFKFETKFSKKLNHLPKIFVTFRQILTLFFMINLFIFVFLLSQFKSTILTSVNIILSHSELQNLANIMSFRNSYYAYSASNLTSKSDLYKAMTGIRNHFGEDLLNIFSKNNYIAKNDDLISKINYTLPNSEITLERNYYFLLANFLYSSKSVRFNKNETMEILDSLIPIFYEKFRSRTFINHFSKSMRSFEVFQKNFFAIIAVLAFLMASMRMFSQYHRIKYFQFIYKNAVFFDKKHFSDEKLENVKVRLGLKSKKKDTQTQKNGICDLEKHRIFKDIPIFTIRLFDYFFLLFILVSIGVSLLYFLSKTFEPRYDEIIQLRLSSLNVSISLMASFAKRTELNLTSFISPEQSGVDISTLFDLLQKSPIILKDQFSIDGINIVGPCSSLSNVQYNNCTSALNGLMNNNFRSILEIMTNEIQSPTSFNITDFEMLTDLATGLSFVYLYMEELIEILIGVTERIGNTMNIIIQVLLVILIFVHLIFFWVSVFKFEGKIIKEALACTRIINFLDPTQAFSNSKLRTFLDKNL